MKIKHISAIFIGITSFFILVFFDQITKRLAVLNLKNQEPFILIKNVFQLCYLENRGAAFGILQGRRIFFLIITCIILFLLAYCYVRAPYSRKFRFLRVILVMVSAGAVGNLIDRFYQGYVIDFFYFNLINFPIFNMADIYVTCAAVLFAILVIFRYKESDLTELIQCLRISKKKDDSK